MDAVQEVLDIPGEEVEQQPPIMASDKTAYLQGVAKVDDRLVMIVDADRLLISDDLSEIITRAAA